jgi:hypothetical protein
MVVIRAVVALGHEPGAGGLGREHGGGGVRLPAYKVGSGPVGKMNLAFLFSFRHILDFF